MELIFSILAAACSAGSLAVLLLRRVPEKTVTREEEAKRDLINEGFENLMRYEVNGQTGFEEA